MSLSGRLKRLISNSFVRSVSILVGGTAFSQLITLLTLPVITRLYSPADFSLFAVYSALLGIIGAIACLRLEIAIPMPEKDADAANLLFLAVSGAFLVTLILTFLVFLIPDYLSGLLNQKGGEKYLWLLPVGVFFTALYNAFQYWAVRKNEFSTIAKTRLSQAIGGASTQISMGVLGIVPVGLIFGQVANNAFGVFGLLINTLRREWWFFLSSVNRLELLRLLRQYERFPRISVAESFANNAAVQVPVVLIAAWAIGPEAGFLLLAMRVIQAPVGLIGGAISQVYLSRAPAKNREGELGGFTADIIGGLAKIGIGPLIFGGIVAPELFAMAFGAEWRRAGVLVMWMTPWFIFQFLASPVSMALHVKNNQALALRLQVFGAILRVAMTWLSYIFAPAWIAEAYAISGAIFYLVYLLVVVKAVSTPLIELIRQVKRAFIPVVFWFFSGIVINEILGRYAYAVH